MLVGRLCLNLFKGDKILEYPGVLKEYTADFVEIMDVDYTIAADKPTKKADIIVLRKYGVVRHLAE